MRGKVRLRESTRMQHSLDEIVKVLGGSMLPRTFDRFYFSPSNCSRSEISFAKVS
jgi:hypothetical protein